MPRFVFRLGVGLALIALGLTLTDWALGIRPGVTEANIRRIQTGMTLQEVEVLLGGPATMVWDPEAEWGKRPVGFRWQRTWKSDSAGVEVLFTSDNRVVLTGLDFHPPPLSPFARLRAWLGL